MPHTSSAKKSLRQIAKRRTRNRAVKKGIKDQIKQFTVAVKSGPVDKLGEELKLASKKLDKAAAKRVLHPNTVARRKSRLAKMANARVKAGKA